jgi:hypothetical protein
MPGGYNNPEYFSGTYLWYSGAWREFAGTVVNSHFGYFNAVRIGTTDIGINDRYCAT